MIVEEFITCMTELDIREHYHAKSPQIHSPDVSELFLG